MERIRLFFSPNSVAVIGATDIEGSLERAVLENLLAGAERRSIYPVNPQQEKVFDEKCYASIRAVPETVELAVILSPIEAVAGLVQECGEAGVKAIIIVSTGSGAAPDDETMGAIAASARKHNIRIMGPNCMGVIRPGANLNTTFTRRVPKPGYVAFVSQSAALGSGVLDWAISKNMGFSAFVCLGSMLDVDFGDLVDFFGEDAETRSIILYLESIGNAKKFLSAARGFARTKPIIVLKPGRFHQPAGHAKPYSGAVVGEDLYYDAVFRRAGAVRVEQIEDLFNCASILNTARLPKGPSLGIVSNAGGPAALAADMLLNRGGRLAELDDSTISSLTKFLPSNWSKSNPIDVLSEADATVCEKTIEAVNKDTGVNGIVVIHGPRAGVSPVEIAKAVAKQVKDSHKPVLATLMGNGEAAKARQLLYEGNIPTYEFPEDAVRTYLYMYEYARNLESLYETPEEVSIEMGAPKNHLNTLIHRAAREGRVLLSTDDSRKFLTTYRISSIASSIASSADAAARLATDIGYPVAMKIYSPDIVHKSDVGGVRLNISSAQDAKKAFAEIMANAKKSQPDATIEGVGIQQMIPHYNYEIIIGSKKDPVFGPVIMFALGGIEAEFFRDISLGLPPLNQVLARRLLEQTKMYRLLSQGFRTKPPANLRLLEETLVRVSNLIIDFPEIKEIDINPLVITDTTAIALDARIVLDKEVLGKGVPEYSHLIITPYPTRYVQPWITRDGRQVLLRPIRPEDEPLERELIAKLSPDSMRFRFFYMIKEITHEMLTRFCNIDYDREMAIIAEYTSDGKRRNVGVGRLVIQPGGETGEFATLVADDFQDNGLGMKLTDMLIGIAQEKGLSSIYGIVLSDNTRMIRLARRLGFSLETSSGGESRVILQL